MSSEGLILLTIDPGTLESGWSIWNAKEDLSGCFGMGICPNEDILQTISNEVPDVLVIEEIVSYGQSIGKTTIDTIVWIGRFLERQSPGETYLMPRREVKLWLTDSVRTKDKHVRQVVLDRMGPKSTKKDPNPRYPLPYPSPRSHEFSALALAITWIETKGADLIV